MILLLFLSCSPVAHDAGDTFTLFDKWVQLDKYFQDMCFYLDSETHNVSIYEEGEKEIEVKDWDWQYYPPELLVVDDRDLTVYNKYPCWELEAYGQKSQICKCVITIPS